MSVHELTKQPTDTLRCAECGRPWLDSDERWHGELTVGDDENEEKLRSAVFCPECAAREFGGHYTAPPHRRGD